MYYCVLLAYVIRKGGRFRNFLLVLCDRYLRWSLCSTRYSPSARVPLETSQMYPIGPEFCVSRRSPSSITSHSSEILTSETFYP